MNYGRNIPLDRNNIPYNGAPPAFQTQQSQAGTPLVSSVVSLSPNTTSIEISAVSGTAGSGGIIGKWGPDSVTGTNFDLFVSAGVTRAFVIPQSVFGAPASSVAGIRDQFGLYKTLSLKGATAQSTSVFTIES